MTGLGTDDRASFLGCVKIFILSVTSKLALKHTQPHIQQRQLAVPSRQVKTKWKEREANHSVDPLHLNAATQSTMLPVHLHTVAVQTETIQRLKPTQNMFM